MDTQKLIVDKITAVLESTDKNQSAELKKLIDQAGHIFVAGAGRSKLVSSFLAMRLVHCGYNVSMVGEMIRITNVIGKDVGWESCWNMLLELLHEFSETVL